MREAADDTAYYESLIPKLYKPLRKTAPAPTPKEENPAAEEQEEPKLTVVYPQQEESGESEEKSPKPATEEPKPQKPASMVERWKRWLERKVTEVVMDE